MRAIKKKVAVREIIRYFYDRNEKIEKTDTVTVAEFETEPALPANCILIEKQTISEKTVVYSMTPEVFLKNATIEK